jgi:hypothetical protein
MADPDRGRASDRRELAVFTSDENLGALDFLSRTKSFSFSNAIFIDRYTISVIENVRKV